MYKYRLTELQWIPSKRRRVSNYTYAFILICRLGSVVWHSAHRRVTGNEAIGSCSLTCVEVRYPNITKSGAHSSRYILHVPSNGASCTPFSSYAHLLSASLILICIEKHPRANGNTRSRSVSLQSALITPASRALVVAALTSPSQLQRQLFPSVLLFSGHFHVGTCAIGHCVTTSPPSASSPCPATSEVEAASQSSWPC